MINFVSWPLKARRELPGGHGFSERAVFLLKAFNPAWLIKWRAARIFLSIVFFTVVLSGCSPDEIRADLLNYLTQSSAGGVAEEAFNQFISSDNHMLTSSDMAQSGTDGTSDDSAGAIPLSGDQLVSDLYPPSSPDGAGVISDVSPVSLRISPVESQALTNRSGKENYAKSIPVLTYHHILDESENTHTNNKYIISTESFSEQMHLLKELGYHTISLNELEDFLTGRSNLPEKSIMITFDDGYKSNFTNAYPILKELGFRSIIFVITANITEEVQPFDPNLFQFASRQELMDCSDVFEYGSHTHNLHGYDEKKGAYHVWKQDEEIEKDFSTSRDILNAKSFAYPYGCYSSKTISILKKLGFTMSFSTNEGYVSPGDNRFILKRWSITPEVSLERFRKIIRHNNGHNNE